MAGFSAKYRVKNDDIVTYLEGTWKRNLEWRHFGGEYQHLRTSNTVVRVTETLPNGSGGGKQEASASQLTDESRWMQWSFGSHLANAEDNLEFGYLMKFIPDRQGTFMESTGTRCHGNFDPDSGVIVLNFTLERSRATLTYRVIDDSSMAVCLIEVGDGILPTVQYGNMHRVQLDNYAAAATT